ncbi:hypothetical protein F5B20DRAFT_586917 [Whalleya microplaca]|nr:hypothetical protein F5B20DRAFT_586917 [Whalleya microplaca]
MPQPTAVCAVCQLPKFKEAQDSSLIEIAAQSSDGPMKKKELYQFWSTIDRCGRDWWFRLSHIESPWLYCPVAGCRHSLRCDDVAKLFQDMGIPKAIRHTRKFEQANQLRAALQALSPRPTQQESIRAIELHRRLKRHAKMWPLQQGIERGVNVWPVEVEILPMDSADGQETRRVPVFTHLLRPRIPCQCILESKGRNAVGRITCPSLGCGHTFTHTEVRKLSRPETFAEYDRLAVLNMIGEDPNFRQCLRTSCSYGGLYDGPDAPPPITPGWRRAWLRDPNHILCTACCFSMCFKCQVPWHFGQSCEEFASHRRHGDPAYERTQQWIAKNTKACPGNECGVPAQKGDGCFRMICSVCQHEFCWECLAAWREIFGRRGFRQRGHRESCYSRDADSLPATNVMGRTLDWDLQTLGLGMAI